MAADDVGGVDVLIFEAAGFRLGADASCVVRVAKSRSGGAIEGFGPASPDARAIVARAVDGTTLSVAVDHIFGVRNVRRDALRPLPGFLRGLVHPALIGFALDGDGVIGLVELAAAGAAR
jgi:hypothetical protein